MWREYSFELWTPLTFNSDNLISDSCIKMALVHDLAECIVGDITPYDGISKEEKNRRETQAIQQITSSLPKSIADEVTSLWEVS